MAVALGVVEVVVGSSSGSGSSSGGSKLLCLSAQDDPIYNAAFKGPNPSHPRVKLFQQTIRDQFRLPNDTSGKARLVAGMSWDEQGEEAQDAAVERVKQVGHLFSIVHIL